MIRPDVRVVSSAHAAQDARLCRIATALADAGLTVTIHAGGPALGLPRGVRTRRVRGPSWVRRMAVNLWVLFLPARVLVVLDPDLAITGQLWRRFHRGSVVADVHEDYVAVVDDRGWVRPWSRWAVVALARASARAAAASDLTVVADAHLPPLQAHRRLVVRNVPMAGDLPSPAPPDEQPRALYIGDLRRSRGLFDMVESVLTVEPWTLDLVGPVTDRDRDELAAMVSGRGGSDRVRVHGRLPVREAWRLASGAWVGFALLHDTPAFRRATPTKLLEYVASGLPVLVSDLPPLRAFVERTESGVVAEGLQEVVATLRDWRDDPSPLTDRRHAALAWRDRILAETPFDRLASEIADLVPPETKAPS